MSHRTEFILEHDAQRERQSNKYVLHCFDVTMAVYTIVLVLNLVGIFIIDKDLMTKSYMVNLFVYLFVKLVLYKNPLKEWYVKYIILLGVLIVHTVMGMYLTYHYIILSVLPFLYAVIYASKKIMVYTYIFSVISTVFAVYGGYYFGLCDANMILLTTTTLKKHVAEGFFINPVINENPEVTLALYYVFPRCMVYVVVVFVCISIYKIVNEGMLKAKLSEELEKAVENAQHANRAKTDFLSSVSHEIRTPINVMLGMNEMILSETTDQQVIEHANMAYNAGQNLLYLVKDILDFSKIETGKIDINERPYKTEDLFQESYNMVIDRTKAKSLQLRMAIDEKLPANLSGDVHRITQIMINLLTNAIKYTDEGAIEVRAAFEKQDTEHGLFKIDVEDTGIGIKEENLKDLFSKYARFDLERNENVEGTGLGLNIVQSLTKAMGGTVSVKSIYGKGSTFSIEIPQKVINDEVIGIFHIKNFGGKKIVNDEIKESSLKGRVLVVDDLDMNLVVFKGLLKNSGVEIDTCISGTLCLDMVVEKKYDIIFMDHMMPIMNGIETFRKMKELDNNKNIDTPIVMLTANALSGIEEMYKAEGFADYIIKPVQRNNLCEIIRKYTNNIC